MKILSLITLFSLAAMSIVGGSVLSAASPQSAQPLAPRQAGSAPRSQADDGAAVQLPAAITDPLLLAAWQRVYQQTELIQPTGSVAVSGRSLAQFVREQAIPVLWDTHNVCSGGSCSVLDCGRQGCAYTSKQPGVLPIYIARSQGDDRQSLTRTLAHEIFHRTQPFGRVLGTRYEEYWAFRVGARIAQADWPVFGQYDPLDPDHLNLWIRENRLDYYFQLPAYPQAVAGLVARAAGGGDPHSGIPAQAYETPASR
jgi:hypothetical protein